MIDVRALLRRLGPLVDDIVLIGGQAVSIWAHLYSKELPSPLRDAPLSSKDIDFCGDNKAVRLAAVRLNGKALFPGMDVHTPNVGVVRYIDDLGEERAIDFLDTPHGLKSQQQVQDRAQQVELMDEGGLGTGRFYRVLHPVHCLISRIANVEGLPGYDTPEALQQLDASIHSCRGFIRQVLAEVGPKAALRLNEEVIHTACSKTGLAVFKKHGLDPFEGVLDDPQFPEQFRAERYQRVKAWLTAKRRTRS